MADKTVVAFDYNKTHRENISYALIPLIPVLLIVLCYLIDRLI